MMEDIVKEHVHTKGTVKNWADIMAMNRAEVTLAVLVDIFLKNYYLTFTMFYHQRLNFIIMSKMI